MPFSTRRSSARGTPRGLLGKKGLDDRPLLVRQFVSPPRHLPLHSRRGLNHALAANSTRFMSLRPSPGHRCSADSTDQFWLMSTGRNSSFSFALHHWLNGRQHCACACQKPLFRLAQQIGRLRSVQCRQFWHPTPIRQTLTNNIVIPN